VGEVTSRGQAESRGNAPALILGFGKVRDQRHVQARLGPVEPPIEVRGYRIRRVGTDGWADPPVAMPPSHEALRVGDPSLHAGGCE
jgi:hypothetical protein